MGRSGHAKESIGSADRTWPCSSEHGLRRSPSSAGSSGSAEQTFYRWKKKFGEMAPSEIKKLKQLEDENRGLKGLVADSHARQADPPRGAPKKRLRPAERRRGGFTPSRSRSSGVSERHALRVTGWPRSTHRYQSQAPDQTPLRMRLRELALARPRYGYRRLTILLRREGWQVNAKRVYRLYREEGLKVRVKRRKKLASSRACPASGCSRAGQRALEHGLRRRLAVRWREGFVCSPSSTAFTRECFGV